MKVVIDPYLYKENVILYIDMFLIRCFHAQVFKKWISKNILKEHGLECLDIPHLFTWELEDISPLSSTQLRIVSKS